MRLRFVFGPTKAGHKNAWTATGLDLPGIGRTQAEAMDNLVRANYAAFGIEEVIVENPAALVTFTRWTAENAATILAIAAAHKRQRQP